MQLESKCPACATGNIGVHGDYGKFNTLACDHCGHMLLERSTAPSQSDDYIVANQAALQQMLKATREKEFDMAVLLAKKHVPQGSWLDIGCSYGWFLQRIQYGGYDAFGVEPSPTAFALAKEAFPGKVLNGEFPTVLRGAPGFPKDYEVMSAMDVLEHIQDPSEFLHSARNLAAHGVLLLKVPCNDGVLFRLASVLSSRRRNGLLGRLWQVDFNYPHWHYYSRRSIAQMLERHGFTVIAERTIPFSFFSTAHDRVRTYDGKREPILHHLGKTLAAYGLICLSYLLQRFDNIIVLAKPTSANASDADDLRTGGSNHKGLD